MPVRVRPRLLKLETKMNKTMLLAIGGAGCEILDVVRRNSKHQEIISAQYSFADSDEFNLKNYADDRC